MKYYRNILTTIFFVILFVIFRPTLIKAYVVCSEPSPLEGVACYSGYSTYDDCCSGTKLLNYTCTKGWRYSCTYYWLYDVCANDAYADTWICTKLDDNISYCWGNKVGDCGGGGGGGCTPGACVGCTPVCPEGYSSTPNSCSTTSATCTGSNGCTSCTITATCYQNETNVAPGMPSSISIIVDDVTYQLSTNPASPTRIKLPSASPTVQLSLPVLDPPSTSNGVGYKFMADNYGVNEEWEGWIDCSGDIGEDFCIEDASNIQTFDPTTLTVLQTLKEGSEGKISGLNYTINKCDNNKLYSLPIEGYYVVDTIPDSEDGDNDPPTKSSTLPDFMTDMTTEGCSSSYYTGKEINNPLRVKIVASDPDGNDEIEAGVIWFSKDESVPNLVDITTNDTLSNINDFGIMIRKNGNWSNPLVYITNETNEWKLITDSDKLSITDMSVVQSTDVTFDFKIVFKESANNPFGLYNLYVGVLDIYMINSNVTDQSRLTDVTDWGIDLTDPSAGDITQEILDSQNLLLSWNVTDLESKIPRIIMNAYRSGGIATAFVELFLPPAPYNLSAGSFQPVSVPSDDQIGILTDLSSAWSFVNNAMSRTETDKINIGANEGGNINIYVTAYDEGCNRSGTYENIDLNPWISSYGGTIYSAGGISNTPKDVSAVTSLYNVFTTISNDQISQIDTGTEIVSSRTDSITQLIKGNGVTAASVYDANDRKSYWYNHLKDKLDAEKNEDAKIFTHSNGEGLLGIGGDANVSSKCNSTICYTETGEEDIVVKTGFVCDRVTLFMTEGDIYLNPNITSSASNTGCIFLAKGNIYVQAGGYRSAATDYVMYDFIDGYLIAESQVVFPLADVVSNIRDGVEIKGGMVAFGNDLSGTSAIQIDRNLKLLSLTNPTIILTYDAKFGDIAMQFFGNDVPIYKQELGFKTF